MKKENSCIPCIDIKNIDSIKIFKLQLFTPSGLYFENESSENEYLLTDYDLEFFEILLWGKSLRDSYDY